MAMSRLPKLQLLAFRSFLSGTAALSRSPCLNSVRTMAYSESGAILERPQRVSFGLFKVLTVVGISVLTGGYISKQGAEFLEEHDLFVPDEDDD